MNEVSQLNVNIYSFFRMFLVAVTRCEVNSLEIRIQCALLYVMSESGISGGALAKGHEHCMTWWWRGGARRWKRREKCPRICHVLMVTIWQVCIAVLYNPQCWYGRDPIAHQMLALIAMATSVNRSLHIPPCAKWVTEQHDTWRRFLICIKAGPVWENRRSPTVQIKRIYQLGNCEWFIRSV